MDRYITCPRLFERNFVHIQLLSDAGITIDNWSNRGYHLARYNDTGGYTFGNCRFIPCAENQAERKISDNMRASSCELMTEYNNSITAEERTRIAKLGGASGSNRLTEQELRDRFYKVEHFEPGRRGFGVRAHMVLGCSSRYVNELKRRWVELGLC